MATTVISARIEDDVRQRAAVYIRAAGLTVGDVIKTVWETIAATGEVPRPIQTDAALDQRDRFAEFMELRASISGCEELADMDDRSMRAEISERYEDGLPGCRLQQGGPR